MELAQKLVLTWPVWPVTWVRNQAKPMMPKTQLAEKAYLRRITSEIAAACGRGHASSLTGVKNTGRAVRPLPRTVARTNVAKLGRMSCLIRKGTVLPGRRT
ncbi:MAG: hypothetical protein QOE32_2510 [Pseudonocardiales bacterium]|nr:hypothetical protein [Pseudonocardiales bacterium]